ncbi:WXG100-like domain-containing protein [Mycobacterium sp. 050134]|uniref:WXG100-like domain-containing protein n=1 Tax=Mycobacterium sp. 050134 TaxID=3096111 RepID=UPI002ED78F42
MVPLVVDPEALFAAGGAVVAAGGGLAANLTILAAGMSAHTGLDVAGVVFGLAYQEAAGSLLKGAAAAINACRSCGVTIQQGAVNYSNAEAASTLGGGSGVLPPPAEPAKVTAPGPPGTLGPGKPPPSLWALVQSFLDDIWPDGDVARLRAAAGRWRNFGASIGGMQAALTASKSLFDSQHLPEGGLIDDALSQIGALMASIGEASGKLAAGLEEFAREVEKAQNAIRDLLDQLGSLTDLVHDVVLIIEGDALDEVKRIAADIGGVQHNLGRQAEAFEQGIKVLTQLGDGLVVKLEKYTRRQLTHFLGDEVGNPVATVFDAVVNANEGSLKGALGMVQGMAATDPRRFLIDPEGAATTWKGMFSGSLVDIALHPKEGIEADRQNWRALLHLDDWSAARPGLGLGENLFDVASLFIPGIGEAGAVTDGTSAAARGAEAAADAAERAGGRAADGLRGLAAARGPLGEIAKSAAGLTEDLDGLAGKLPKIEPPGGRPVGLPPTRAPEPPAGPTARPPESGPAHASPSTGRSDAPGAHAPTSATVPSEQLPDRASVPPRNAPVDPVPVEAHSSEPAPAASTPRIRTPEPDLPTSEAGANGLWDARSPGGGPHELAPHQGEPHERGDRDPGDGGRGASSAPGESSETDIHPGSSADPTPNDVAALADYTGTGYEDLNDALRRDVLDASQSARVEALNNALFKLPPYEGPVVRGAHLPPEMLACYQPGEYIIEKGFLSTTTDPAIAQSDAFVGNVEFRIISFTGRDVAAFSILPEEQEVLFPSHTRFFVLSKTIDPMTGRAIIEMIED